MMRSNGEAAAAKRAMTIERPLRILLVTCMPWSRNLGASRVHIELGEEWQRLGHQVEKYSLEDAFPVGRWRPVQPQPLARLLALALSNRSFAARARRFVTVHAQRFDVIDALEGTLPYPKVTTRFNGLLVARSVGLAERLRDFEAYSARRWPEPLSARRFVRELLTGPGRRRTWRNADRSLRQADLVNVTCQADLQIARDRMSLGDRVVCFPNGLSSRRLESFRIHRGAPSVRLEACTVVSIGNWSDRKGAMDWPQIVAAVRERVPRAAFLFLGTGFSRDKVLMQFPSNLRERLDVVPSFDSSELPRLMESATVGAFPSYMEGFGIAVLEKLAAGLPTVAYDAPGPRDILSRLGEGYLVRVGEADTFADQVSTLLKLSPEEYGRRSSACQRLAGGFRWEEIARETLATYAARNSGLAA